ncbi:hypothetical protein CA163_07010, partial [Vibrio parahaemolyticus]
MLNTYWAKILYLNASVG